MRSGATTQGGEIGRVGGRLGRGSSLAIGALALAACSGAVEPGANGGGADDADLTIRYIERLPRLRSVQGGDPTRDGWPRPGENVTWRAQVKNWAAVSRDVGYSWFLDGEPAGSGSVRIEAGGVGTAELPWPWTFERHVVRFVVDPANEIAEEEEGNNTLEVFTDAISVAFFLDPGTEQEFREQQPRIPAGGSTSFEDWANRHINRFNEMAAAAIYPETPVGVLDRWRLDRIVVAEDGESIGIDELFESDLIFRFGAVAFAGEIPGENFNGDPGSFYRGVLLHELGHGREMIDVYATGVFHGIPGSNIEVLENGELVAGSALLPFQGEVTVSFGGNSFDGWSIRPQLMNGLMATDYSFIDRYSAAAFNRLAGERQVPFEKRLGFFMDELPTSMQLALRDGATDEPLSGAEVRVYQGRRPAGLENVVYPRTIDDVPDLVVQADGNGIVTFDTTAFTDGLLNVVESVALVRVEHEGRVGYDFIYSMLFNLAYWRGETDVAQLELPVTLHTVE